jgi:uncharacterized protein (TIGR02466 family)
MEGGTVGTDQLSESLIFPSKVYTIQKPEFLDAVRSVSDRSLEQSRKQQQGDYMTLMSSNFSHEPEVASFAQYVSQTAWNILQSQGYNMDNLVTFFSEMWTQEHKSFSSMDYHVHGLGAMVSAFYFLDVPENGCQLVLHDPRPTKWMIDIATKDPSQVTDASERVYVAAKAGTIIFTNSWMPHSFTKNFSTEPTRFVHMNLSVAMNPQQPKVEVV